MPCSCAWSADPPPAPAPSATGRCARPDGQAATVGALLEHTGRRSFIVHLLGVAELWEIALDPAAPPLFEGWVHDYRMGEGVAQPGYLGRRRLPLPQPVQALWLHPQVPWLLALENSPSPAPVAVVHLDVRRVIAHLPLPAHKRCATVPSRVDSQHKRACAAPAGARRRPGGRPPAAGACCKHSRHPPRRNTNRKTGPQPAGRTDVQGPG